MNQWLKNIPKPDETFTITINGRVHRELMKTLEFLQSTQKEATVDLAIEQILSQFFQRSSSSFIRDRNKWLTQQSQRSEQKQSINTDSPSPTAPPKLNVANDVANEGDSIERTERKKLVEANLKEQKLKA